jgi:hypothetical protein
METTLADVQSALGAVTSPRRARVAVRRAARVVGIGASEPLALGQLVRRCSALAAEGGAIEQLAQEIASDALREETASRASLAS